MITYLPALCVIHHKYIHKLCGACECCPNQPIAATDRHINRLSVASRFTSALKPLVTHKWFWYAWLLLTVGLAVGLGTQAPDLSYPTSDEIQLFPDDNPLERFCCTGPVAGKQFHDGGADENRLHLMVNWGIEPVDNGNPWDPDSHIAAARRDRSDVDRVTALPKGICERARCGTTTHGSRAPTTARSSSS